tara:strand:+ start:319 stop:702 length:384 start_codon:yes stop_codon:yes gene_type:complete
MKSKTLKQNFILYYDDKCPLCIATISYIKRYINPSNTRFYPISLSELSLENKNRALNDMLLTNNFGQKWWGYYTYAKVFTLTSYSLFKPFYFLISYLMKLPLIKEIGKLIYSSISSRRQRCDDNCSI